MFRLLLSSPSKIFLSCDEGGLAVLFLSCQKFAQGNQINSAYMKTLNTLTLGVGLLMLATGVAASPPPSANVDYLKAFSKIDLSLEIETNPQYGPFADGNILMETTSPFYSERTIYSGTGASAYGLGTRGLSDLPYVSAIATTDAKLENITCQGRCGPSDQALIAFPISHVRSYVEYDFSIASTKGLAVERYFYLNTIARQTFEIDGVTDPPFNPNIPYFHFGSMVGGAPSVAIFDEAPFSLPVFAFPYTGTQEYYATVKPYYTETLSDGVFKSSVNALLRTRVSLKTDTIYHVYMTAEASCSNGLDLYFTGRSASCTSTSYVDPYLEFDPENPDNDQLKLLLPEGVGNSPPAVPEPGNFTLLVAGLCLVAGVVHRKNRRFL